MTPSLTYKQGRPIVIGNIIKDPLAAHKALIRHDQESLERDFPPISTVKHSEREMSTDNGVSFNTWSKSAERLGSKIQTKFKLKKKEVYTIKDIEVSTFSEDPPADTI